jgi:hypothetical protein
LWVLSKMFLSRVGAQWSPSLPWHQRRMLVLTHHHASIIIKCLANSEHEHHFVSLLVNFCGDHDGTFQEAHRVNDMCLFCHQRNWWRTQVTREKMRKSVRLLNPWAFWWSEPEQSSAFWIWSATALLPLPTACRAHKWWDTWDILLCDVLLVSFAKIGFCCHQLF